MKILSVFDPEFKPYGKVVTGMDEMVHSIVAALANTPLPEGVGYVPEEPLLQQLPAAAEVSTHLYGGMPVQLGWCNGHNTKLNCLEYHRDSEFNLGAEDFILLLAKAEDVVDGKLDTAKVKAFRAPAGRVLCHHAALCTLPLRRQQGLPRADRPAEGHQHRPPRPEAQGARGRTAVGLQQVAAGAPRVGRGRSGRLCRPDR